MTKINLFLLLFVLLMGTSCNGKRHLLADDAFRAEVEKDFQAKKTLLPAGELFTVFDQPLTDDEREALTFLYAYMPIGDITDYDGQLYLDNIRSSLRARVEMPWGDSIPDDIFLHFVLPIRVNNENLDESRMVFYEELKDRVKGLSLHDAILEVNHWCHEKVIYTPSDARTSSPLASVKTAYGRCGEESTFTVAALRSVGIPARQVYTPRWAHTDDNHAWVEAWVNGKWYFMGACEPEPVLNLGWFNGPAYRSMLMHTKVFGKYHGPEEIMDTTACYTEINVTSNYAPTAQATVTVVNAQGQPVPGANVEFKIYNYAEFYTVANKTTDAEGRAFLSAGKGDMLVWATKDGRFGYSKVSFGKDENVTLTLDKLPGHTESIALDIVPPVDGSIPAEVTDEQKAANALRLHQEDSIRNQYVATFYTQEKAAALAKELGTDEQKTTKFLLGSRGNWKEIERFLRETPADRRPMAIDLLDAISAKDLRDTPASVLRNHLDNVRTKQHSLFTQYVLNPRVANEFLTPYRTVFQQEFNPELAKQAKGNPQLLVAWVKQNIRIGDELNPQRIPMMPTGVWRSRVADTDSRNIFFVALCRSLGIPARIDPVTGKVQYARKLQWTDVDFDATQSANAPQGRLTASYAPIRALDDPKYYDHFTISRITEDGRLSLLGYAEGAKWSQLLKNGLTLDAGNYLMVSGTRLANGGVLSHLVFFTIEPGKTTNVELVMRESRDEVQVIGSFDSESTYMPIDGDLPRSILSTTGRGYFVVGVLGVGQEPTNHALKDIAAVSKAFEQWGRKMVLLFPSEEQYRKFNPDEFPGLPSTITYGIDTDGAIQKQLREQMKLKGSTLPIFIIGDTFNRVVFCSHGYTIGIGEQMMKVAHKL